jgi:hypothetical protein
MPRDFRTELSATKCWDRKTESLMENFGIPREDAILQNREELIGLCEWIDKNDIHSYLEIGIWTGALISQLHRLFHFDRAFACDIGQAELAGLSIQLPPEIELFRGNSRSPEFLAWRASLGHIDLVMLDGDHRYRAIKRDFEINRRFDHRFIAVHDITGYKIGTSGVKRFWDELQCSAYEIIRPHIELGLYCSTMGIGIVQSNRVLK